MVKKYSVKEISKLSGLTPRTIQYYDNEGIMRAARDELGHRFILNNSCIYLNRSRFIGLSASL
ncbi:MerR family DNA-binding transcriptional regulator [Paenibacillus sp. JCM 10914]|uniref:MerR family DNA-binding transcriptional regulator n=1 Tax=Paenibacillus sp. JCM 10914 TaxID=1236974 RepID=UPI000A83F9AD|nr:MerR family DNA-binding transcriptional regulator [Paenibacillus sp. JCM 10914]